MNDLPQDWEPGHNIGWRSGHSDGTRRYARVMLFIMAAWGMFCVCAALSGCCTFCNRGEAFTKCAPAKHQIAEAGKMIKQEIAQ